MPNQANDVNKTPVFEWYVVRCGSMNGYQKDTCLKEIELCAQNMLSILGLIVNINGGTYQSFDEHDNLHFIYA